MIFCNFCWSHISILFIRQINVSVMSSGWNWPLMGRENLADKLAKMPKIYDFLVSSNLKSFSDYEVFNFFSSKFAFSL